MLRRGKESTCHKTRQQMKPTRVDRGENSPMDCVSSAKAIGFAIAAADGAGQFTGQKDIGSILRLCRGC